MNDEPGITSQNQQDDYLSFVMGEQIGPYRLVEKLGQGGMATVYKAYHASLDRFVAIKAIHPAFITDPDFLARFQREARVVGKLEHPNIASVYDFAEHQGRPYLVMKYLEGPTLKEAMEERTLEQEEILQVAKAIGSALTYAHQQGILHRDIKPSNVLLSNDGQVYLVDFGLARIVESGESSLTSDRIIGTPQYISPEQAVGQAELDNRTDIYSFGIMLYEMIVGTVPFHADTPFAIIHDHIFTPLPPPCSINPDISESVERVLVKALAKEREDRFGDIPALMQALVQALDTSNSESPAPPPPIFDDPAALNSIPSIDDVTIQADSHQIDDVVNDRSPQDPILTQQKKTGTKKKIIVVLAGLFSLIALTILCLFIGNRIYSDFSNSRAAQETETIENPGSVQPDPTQPTQGPKDPSHAIPNETAAMEALQSAVSAWRRGDMVAAENALDQFRMSARPDIQFYQDVIEYLEGEQAYLISAILLFDTNRAGLSDEIINISSNISHAVLYRAAFDPLADEFLDRNNENQLFIIAQTRHEFYYGDRHLAISELQNFLEKPIRVSRFPEAYLLEAEIHYSMDDPQALDEVERLLSTDQPEWIITAAKVLQEKIINQNSNGE